MLDRSIKQHFVLTSKHAGFSQEKISAILAIAEDKQPTRDEALPLLVTQAHAARLASVSRFTIRKMVEAGKLHPVEILPGLFRYRVEELLKL